MSFFGAQSHEPPKRADATPSPPPVSAPSGQITLQVGERKFHTTVETLVSESEYFKAMFAGRWPVKKQPDGSCFIDADPVLFEHILRFMRQGTFPILLKGTSVDFGLYRALLDSVRFFQVTRLEAWIASEKYRQRVVTTHAVSELPGFADVARLDRSYNAGEEAEYFPSVRTRLAYQCPRGIGVHQDPTDCGRACDKARADSASDYREEQYWSAVIVRKTVKIVSE